MKGKVTLILVLIFFAGCLSDAPRDNPYDLYNPKAGGYITGVVSCFSGKGIKNAYVLIDSIYSTLTDNNGRYFYGPLRPGSLMINVSRSGYVSESKIAFIEPGFTDTVNFVINAIPYFVKKTVYSRSSKWYSMGWLYEVLIEAIVVDSDYIFDVESVMVSTGDTILPLKYVSPTGESGYSALFKGKLQGADVLGLTGDNFLLNAYDTRGSHSSAQSTLYNFVDTFATPVSPTGGDEVDMPLTLVWRKFPGFYYHLLLWRREAGMDEPIVDVDSIPTMDTVYTINSLAPGYYEWAVFIVDSKFNMGGKVSYFLVP